MGFSLKGFGGGLLSVFGGPIGAAVGGALLASGSKGGGGGGAAGRAASEQEKLAREGIGRISPFTDTGLEANEQLLGNVFQGFDTDPDRVLKNPLFQKLLAEKEQRLIGQQAGLGRTFGSGSLLDRLGAQTALDFQNQDIQRQQFEAQVPFNQLDRIAGRGLQAGVREAQALQGIGNVRAGGIIGDANEQARRREQNTGLGLGFLGEFLPGDIGAGFKTISNIFSGSGVKKTTG